MDAENVENDENEGCCPICMEVWTATGNHRIVSIKCGHLFGKNCIEKWIARKPKESKCPQCNNPCSKRDIRQIYLPGKQLSAGTVDMAAYEDLAEQLRREKATRFQVENKYNQLTLTQKTFQDEIDYWKAEALRQKNELIAVKQKQLQIDQMLNEISSVSNSPQRSTLSNTPRRKLTSRFCGAVDISKAQGASKVMSFCRQTNSLAMSKSSEAELGPVTHGIVNCRLDRLDYLQFIRQIHEKPIRDAKFSPRGDQLILSTSWDKQLKITCAGRSGSIVQSFQLDAMGWCCDWDPDDPMLVRVGQSNNRISLFDIRSPDAPLKQLCSPLMGGAHTAVHSIVSVPRLGLVCGSFEGVFLWRLAAGDNEAKCEVIEKCPMKSLSCTSVVPSEDLMQSPYIACAFRENGTNVRPRFKVYRIPHTLSAEIVVEDENDVCESSRPPLNWECTYNWSPVAEQQHSIYRPAFFHLPQQQQQPQTQFINLVDPDHKRKRAKYSDPLTTPYICTSNESQKSVQLWSLGSSFASTSASSSSSSSLSNNSTVAKLEQDIRLSNCSHESIVTSIQLLKPNNYLKSPLLAVLLDTQLQLHTCQ